MKRHNAVFCYDRDISRKPYSYTRACKEWHSMKQCDAHVFTKARWHRTEAERRAMQELAWFDPDKDSIPSFRGPTPPPEQPPVWQPTPRNVPNPPSEGNRFIDWKDTHSFGGHEFRTRFLIPVR
jgi:hypothetical protein